MQKKSGINVKKTTVTLTVLAVLTALQVVISMFCTIKTQAINITLTFIPVVIAAKLYGASGAGLVAGLGDIIGWIIHPLGALFPPITLTTILCGMIFGFFLERKTKLIFIIIPVLITQLVFSTFVTPLWLSILYPSKYSYSLLLVTRIPQIAVMIAVELIMIPFILKALERVNLNNLFEGRKLAETK